MAPGKRIRLGRNGQHEVKLSTAKIANGKMKIKKTDRRNKYFLKICKIRTRNIELRNNGLQKKAHEGRDNCSEII